MAPAARRLLGSDRAAPIRESWTRLSNGLRDLESQDRDWLQAEALAPGHHLALMQRISGITLHGAPDRTVQAHRAAVARTLVDRHLRAMARARDRVAVDRVGVLAPIVSGELLGLSLLDADPHQGGQRSVALRFARGPELVLKPRDVRLDGFVVGERQYVMRPERDVILHPQRQLLQRADRRMPLRAPICGPLDSSKPS